MEVLVKQLDDGDVHKLVSAGYGEMSEARRWFALASALVTGLEGGAKAVARY